MHEYLAEFFRDDLTKSYYYIDEKTTAKLRQRSRASFRIKGYMDQVLIAANPYDAIMTDESVLHCK